MHFAIWRTLFKDSDPLQLTFLFESLCFGNLTHSHDLPTRLKGNWAPKASWGPTVTRVRNGMETTYTQTENFFCLIFPKKHCRKCNEFVLSGTEWNWNNIHTEVFLLDLPSYLSMFVCHKNITVNATFCAQAAVCFHYVINQTHQKPMFFCSLLAKSDPTLLWPLSSIPNKPYGFCGHQAPCLLTRCGPRSSKIKTKSTSFVQVLTELNVLYQYHKQGLHVCQMYQTPGTMFFTLHWQKVTHHGCDLSSSNSKKKKKRTSFVQMLKESFTNIHSQVLTFYHHNTPLLNCLTHVQRLGGMPSMGSFIVGLVHIGVVVVAKDTPKLGDPDSSVGLDVALPPSVGKSRSSSSVHQYLLT